MIDERILRRFMEDTERKLDDLQNTIGDLEEEIKDLKYENNHLRDDLVFFENNYVEDIKKLKKNISTLENETQDIKCILYHDFETIANHIDISDIYFESCQLKPKGYDY